MAKAASTCSSAGTRRRSSIDRPRRRLPPGNQRLFQEIAGNRQLSGLPQVSEDFAWRFRDGQVIPRPPAALTARSLADANGDGRVHLKSYEIGIGDEVRLPADVELRRAKGGVEVKTNIPATLSLRSHSSPCFRS